MDNGQQVSTDPQIDEQAVALLLSTAQNEYSNEHERTATLDSKAGIALPIISAFFLAFAEMNNYKWIIGLPVNSIWTSLLPITLFISYTLGLVLALIAVMLMAGVLFAKDYYRINPPDLYTEQNLMNKGNDFSITLMHCYFKAIEYNRNTNNKRVESYQKSWKLTFLSVVCFVIYILIKNNS